MDGVEQDTASTRAIAEHPPAGMSILPEHIAAGDTMIKDPGNSGHVAHGGSVLHSLSTSVTLQSLAVNLETSAAGDNCINDALRYENSPPGSDSATFGLSEILEFVSSSQIGSNFKLAALNSLIQSYDSVHFLSDDSGTRLLAKLLTLGQLLLDRATMVDSSSDIDRSIEYLTRAAQVGAGEPTAWLEAVNLLSSAHRTRFGRYGKAEDIGSAIEYLNQTIPFAKNSRDMYAMTIAERGSLPLLRFEISGVLNDLREAIESRTSIDLSV
ncbi:hypothetical protein BDV93DRAFT_514398 [Ceratobasidium sp. AG-I]|nr:hypothetical protein BDV93DRAFT_514398 [Ceratobasidium sp. AG-I]